MGKTYSCHFENCGIVFTKQSDLKKHIVEHEDPSKLFRCTQCTFVTLYPRSLIIHQNTHPDSRPHTCPDMIIDDSSSTEMPCSYRANCTSALLKHRKKYHGYVPNATRSRQDASTTSQVDRRPTPASRCDPFPVSPKTTTSSSRASYSAPYSYAHAYLSVPSPSSSIGQPFDNKHYSLPDTHHGVTTLPFPTLPNSPATVLNQNSFHYVTNNAIRVVTSNDAARTSPEPPYDATSFAWRLPSGPETESTDSESVTSYTANSYNSESAGSYVAFPPSPTELPLDDTVCSETDTLQYGDASNGNEDMGTSAVEPIDANTSVAPQNNYAERSDTLPAPFPLPVQPVLPETLLDDYTASDTIEIVPSFSDFDSDIHEDEIFFRGTGREGCLCPEMMVNAGVEGWGGSLLNTHQEYSFA